MDYFENAIKLVLKFEGGYSNNSADRGGETNYGITIATARGAGYNGQMRDMTVDQAKEIYRKLYWDKPKFGEFINQAIAIEVFDQGVNMGTGTAIKHLQTAYNYLNEDQLAVDGVFGPKTAQAINSYTHPSDLLNCLCAVRIAHYLEIVERDPSQRVFLRGWLRRANKAL